VSRGCAAVSSPQKRPGDRREIRPVFQIPPGARRAGVHGTAIACIARPTLALSLDGLGIPGPTAPIPTCPIERSVEWPTWSLSCDASRPGSSRPPLPAAAYAGTETPSPPRTPVSARRDGRGRGAGSAACPVKLGWHSCANSCFPAYRFSRNHPVGDSPVLVLTWVGTTVPNRPDLARRRRTGRAMGPAPPRGRPAGSTRGCLADRRCRTLSGAISYTLTDSEDLSSVRSSLSPLEIPTPCTAAHRGLRPVAGGEAPGLPARAMADPSQILERQPCKAGPTCGPSALLL
jgi:hypothetical protein